MIMINVIYSLGYFRCFPSHLNLQKRGSIMNTANTSAQYYAIHAATELSLSDLYQAWQHLSQDEIIIDIRSPADYASAHVPGSRNIPYSSVIERCDELRKYHRVYFYCYGGQGSNQVASKLVEMGFENIYYLGNAGMSDWQSAGHPVSRH